MSLHVTRVAGRVHGLDCGRRASGGGPCSVRRNARRECTAGCDDRAERVLRAAHETGKPRHLGLPLAMADDFACSAFASLRRSAIWEGRMMGWTTT